VISDIIVSLIKGVDCSDGSGSKVFDSSRGIFLLLGSGQPPLSLENVP